MKRPNENQNINVYKRPSQENPSQSGPPTVNTDMLKRMLRIDENPGNSKGNGRMERVADTPPNQRQTNQQNLPGKVFVNKNLPTADVNQDTRNSDNIEILKDILKIGKNNTDRQSSRDNPNAPVFPENTLPQDKISFDIFAQAAKAPASVRLLTYYQSNGLGLPRYQYCNTKNSVQSQLTLPSGEVVIGKPARTREVASENVAADALEIFMRKANSDQGTAKSAEGFPVPPKTWVKTDKSKNNKERQGSDQQTNQSANKNKTDATVLNNSFVPLQAIKNHIGKVNNTSNTQPSDDTALRENELVEESSKLTDDDKDSQKGQNSSTQNERKPKKERKTRIAANFVSKKK